MLEKYLFDGLDPLAEECMIFDNPMFTSSSILTPQQGAMRSIREIVSNAEQELKNMAAVKTPPPMEEPVEFKIDPCPVFMFTPSKQQIVKMIIRAMTEQGKAQAKKTK